MIHIDLPQLTTEDMAAGVVMGHQVSPLKADDCLLIGTTAFDLGEFRSARNINLL